MITNNILTRVLDKIITQLSACNPIMIIIVATIFVLFTSVPLVYMFSIIFDVEYTNFLFSISILLPLILTPLTLAIIIRLTKHLKHVRVYLADEIGKNKSKDIMLFEQARFALMGEMMANISHQWKQPLNTIGLAVVSTRTSDRIGDTLDRNFDIIEDNVNYLASTIDDFMSFFDKKTHLDTKDLSSIVKEIKSIIEVHMQNKDIKLNIVVEDGCCDVSIASSISQVLLNLLSNSKDAFDDVRPSRETKDKEITLKFITAQDGLKICCCDNGKGINIDIRDKIFDPYFTTKDKMQGTGIGLYMSKQIVQKVFGGEIDVSSECGISSKSHYDETCFNMFIPYSDKCILKKKQ